MILSTGRAPTLSLSLFAPLRPRVHIWQYAEVGSLVLSYVL